MIRSGVWHIFQNLQPCNDFFSQLPQCDYAIEWVSCLYVCQSLFKRTEFKPKKLGTLEILFFRITFERFRKKMQVRGCQNILSHMLLPEWMSACYCISNNKKKGKVIKLKYMYCFCMLTLYHKAVNLGTLKTNYLFIVSRL